MNSNQNLDFDLTEEMTMLRRTAREFSESEILPKVMQYDEAQEFPANLMTRMAELGFLGATVPEELGGAGMTAREFAVIMEELGRVDPSVALTLAAHSGLCLEHILLFADDEQKRNYVPDLATGKTIGSWCLTEPGSGSDAAAMLTTAEKRGSKYIVNGTKNFITNGSHASTFVVMTRTDPAKGKAGISAFIVEKQMGVRVGKKENKLGFRASDTVQLVFENVEVPAENLLGKEGEGLKQALAVLDSGRVGVAALAVGLAQGAMEASIRYAKERKAFGKALGEFQGIQFKVADMATEIQAARLLTLRAADAKALGKPLTLVAAYAKYFASEVAQRVATEAVQIHGGYGYIKEFPVEKFYRDAKLLTIGEGTSEVQRMVIAKNILG
ncbi:MAG: acyl-CoA dehydrogenase family protein [Ignavibacteriales bacterium]|nr:acyl-CoA dehydrogenase family protein [Ignavibacteriales bacterium]